MDIETFGERCPKPEFCVTTYATLTLKWRVPPGPVKRTQLLFSAVLTGMFLKFLAWCGPPPVLIALLSPKTNTFFGLIRRLRHSLSFQNGFLIKTKDTSCSADYFEKQIDDSSHIICSYMGNTVCYPDSIAFILDLITKPACCTVVLKQSLDKQSVHT